MNKMFTAVAVLTLVQAGRLGLNDPIGKYLTDYPNERLASTVTIHHLLTHTGGTGDFFGIDFMAHRLELRTHADYVKLFGAREVLFEPGTQWSYSNYGFILLGAVIERISGEPITTMSTRMCTSRPGWLRPARRLKTSSWRIARLGA